MRLVRSRYAWILVGLLWVVAVLNYLDRQVVFTLFPLLQKDLHVSNVQLGLLGTVFLWVYGVLSPFGGYLADRYSRTRVIVFSLMAWSVVTYLTGHARGISELLFTRGLMGISEAFYLPAALAMIADHHRGGTRSLATGIHQSGLYVGITLGGVGGGWIGQHYGWRAVFGYLGAVGVAYCLVLLFALRQGKAAEAKEQEAPAERPAFLPAIRELWRVGAYRRLILVQVMAALAYWTVYTWLPVFLYERFRMSIVDAGFSATFYIQAASVAGILAGGALADRWSRTNARGRLLTQAIGFAAAGPALFLVGTTRSFALLVAGLILFGLGRGFFDCNTMPVLCQVARPHLWATGYGVFNFVSCISGGAMSAAAGSAKDLFGLGAAIQASALMLALAALLLWRIRLAPE
jgi:MFS family permease